MFTACPHCQFLVVRDPQADAAPTDCPRCGKPLATGSPTPASASPSLATFLTVAPAPVEATASDPVDDAVDAAASPQTPAADDASADLSPHDAEDTPATAAEDSAADMADATDIPASAAEATPAQDAVTDDVLQAATSPVAIVTPDNASAPARKTNGPRFLHRARTSPAHARRARGQWAAVIALSLLLCVQVVLADRTRFAAQAGWRPIVLALCGAFRCEVPAWREPAAFTMLSRDVRPVIGRPGTLQAQATFRNEARWAQAWPVILLTLKDADGRTLGARTLQPGDYLADGEASSPIGPGQSAQMAVQVREPSANVVAFSFDFR